MRSQPLVHGADGTPMKALGGRRVGIVTGDGVVGRFEHGLVIVHGEREAIEALLADVSLDTAAGVDELCRVASRGLPHGIAGLVVVTAGEGLDVVTAGPEHVSVDGVEPPAQQRGVAVVRSLRDAGAIRLGVALGRVGVASDLRGGVVPGAGVVLYPAAATTHTHSGQAQPENAWDAAADGPPEREAGGPPVDVAGNEAHDDTRQWVPPMALDDTTAVAASREAVRGRLVFDDGMTVTLDRSYVIGRELPDTGDPSLAPLVVDDDEHSVSRQHAEVRLDRDVVVRDLGSSNGTRVWDPAASAWQRLETGAPLVLTYGTYIAVGRRVFVYEPPPRD